MNFLNRLSISQKIYLIPIIGSLSFITYIIISSISAKESSAHLLEAKNIQFPIVQLSKSIEVSVVNLSETLNLAVTSSDEDLFDKSNELAASIKKNIDKISKKGRQFSAIAKRISSEFAQYFELANTLSIGMVSETIDYSKLPEMGKAMNDSLEKVNQTIQEFNQEQVGIFESAIDQANKSTEYMLRVGYIMGAINIVLLFAVALPIIRLIRSSVIDVVKSLRDIAEGDGDLTVRIETKAQDEIGELVTCFNLFIEKLQATIKEVVDIALPLSNMATLVSSNAEETSHITLQLQSGAQNTKEAVTELNTNVQTVAESASVAEQATVSTINISTKGEGVVKETISTIHQLAEIVSESSDVINSLDLDTREVGVVLDVIRGIADQTNLLALNAAIEAARAGEQGRGFAVVADEVRTLASRTQQSTVEIQATIEKLQSAAQDAVSAMNSGRVLADKGVEQVSKAGESLADISSSISEINVMTSNIAKSTEDQAKVTDSIVTYVDDASLSAGQTHSASQEMATVSNELAELAYNLEKIAKSFKVS
jgi:methyl-accepting chemotaxis protein